MKNAIWTQKQLARLKVIYPIVSRKQLECEFYPHPISSILTVGLRLGLRRPARKTWMEKIASYSATLEFAKSELRR